MTEAKKTTTGPAVYAAIAAVMADLAGTGIAKDRRNSAQGYNFRGIDEVYNALSPIMAKHGLVMLPTVIAREVVERTTQKGQPLFFVTVEAEFDLVAAADGSSHVVKTFGEAMDTADKATNKAMSAAYKYAAMQAFCIPTAGDNDADATTHDLAPRQPEGPSAAAQFAADQLRQTKTKAEFTHFWESNKAGLREQLDDADMAHVIAVMKAEAKRFSEPAKPAPAENTPFDQQEKKAA